MFVPKQRAALEERVRASGIEKEHFDFSYEEKELKLIYKPAEFHFRIVINSAPDIASSLEPGVYVYYTPDNRLFVPVYRRELRYAVQNWTQVERVLDKWLLWIHEQYNHSDTLLTSLSKLSNTLAEASARQAKQRLIEQKAKASMLSEPTPPSLAHLHLTIQQAAGSLFATGHYRQALLDACIAIDNAVRDKSQLAGSGTRLMEAAFSPGNPILKIGDSTDEQQGFLSLFRGLMLAVRNPKAHSLGGTADAQRALEWLSFASVLMRNLDEAVLAQPIATPPTP
jgi:uncharacterized protein (TIGR02391 family)